MRDIRFTFVCDLEERQLIAALAKSLRRSQGDAVRFAVTSFALGRVEINPPKSEDASGNWTKPRTIGPIGAD